MTEYEPFRSRDCLLLVDAIRNTMEAHTLADGCLSPHGMKIVRAALEGLEMKLGGERKGPVNVSPRTDGR